MIRHAINYLSKGNYYYFYSVDSDHNPLYETNSNLLLITFILKPLILLSLWGIALTFSSVEYVYDNGGHWDNSIWYDNPPSKVRNDSITMIVFVIGLTIRHLLKRLMSHFTLSYTPSSVILCVISISINGSFGLIFVTSITTLISLIFDFIIIKNTKDYILHNYKKLKNRLNYILSSLDIDDLTIKLNQHCYYNSDELINREYKKIEEYNKILNFNVNEELRIKNIIKNKYILKYLKSEPLIYTDYV